jgi:hypothetical protein
MPVVPATNFYPSAADDDPGPLMAMGALASAFTVRKFFKALKSGIIRPKKTDHQ